MKYFVYILICNDKSYYIGHTNNIENRLKEHIFKKYSGYTSSRLPIKLVFSKEFDCRDEAFIFERQIKKWSRRKKEALIEGNLEALRLYAKNKINSIHPD